MGKHFITQFTLDNTCGSKKKITPQKTADCKQKTNQKDPKKTGTNGTPGNAARGKTIGNDTGKFGINTLAASTAKRVRIPAI